MSKLPYMPLWVSDFIGDASVGAMDATEIGAYLLLLMYEWSDGPLPTDSTKLSRLARLHGRHKRKLSVVLANFTMTPEGFVNKRLESIRLEQEAKREVLREAGKRGADKRWGGH